MIRKTKTERILTDNMILTDWIIGGLLAYFGSPFWSVVGMVMVGLGIIRALRK